MATKFLAHKNGDSVGVATNDISKNEEVEGVYMDNNQRTNVKAVDNIVLGHKIALKDIKKDEKVMEYGEPVGKATQDIKKGEHVHVHNIRTMRW